MLLGKRPRPPMQRTSSMTRITLDLGPQEPSNEGLLHIPGAANPGEHVVMTTSANGRNGSYDYDQSYFSPTAMVSPRRNPYGTVENIETAQFLRICGLCQRRLVPGRDIYMYRGETAFCSLECREQQMKQDEKKEKEISTITSASK